MDAHFAEKDIAIIVLSAKYKKISNPILISAIFNFPRWMRGGGKNCEFVESVDTLAFKKNDSNKSEYTPKQ